MEGSHLDVQTAVLHRTSASQYKYTTHSESFVSDNFMVIIRPSSAEIRHPVSSRRTAVRGLFTSGIKSAYDIETSGWMKLSQDTGTTCACTLGLTTTKISFWKN